MNEIIILNKKYKIIYSDPPWQYSSRQLYGDKIKNQEKRINRFSRLENKYKTMTINEIKNLPINKIIDNDCACFLWTTDSHIKQAIEVLEAWGFKYKTIAFVWLKKTSKNKNVLNFAPWTLKSTEICLLGLRGSMGKHKTSNNIRQLIEAERTIHSKKPGETRKRIEQLFMNLPRIELFAREKIEGWDVWGDEIK